MRSLLLHEGGRLEACSASTAAESIDDALVISPCMRRVYELVARVACTPLPVLVLGETGVGKELIARAVHAQSDRCRASFRALNCATIPVHLIESVLFGHERGAFTGAERQAAGVFEQAHGGSIFLDEVGELSLHAQAALLRVLELRRVVRVGGTREIEVDVRVIAATHRDLCAMVSAGTFREDLMFRLDALSVSVPPLRERREEILPLAELFLARARAAWNATARSFSASASELLAAWPWPGNVRQLKNVVERAAVVCAEEVIDIVDLPDRLRRERLAEPASLPERVRELEVALIREALVKTRGNQAQAARLLGVPRRTLAHKAHAYDLLRDFSAG